MREYKLIFFYGPLDALRYFVDRFVECSQKKNIQFLIADSTDPESYDLSRLNAFIEGDVPVFMFTMNHTGITLKEGEENYWKKHNISVFDFVQDHPRNYDDVLLDPPCDIKVLSLDKNNIDFIRRFYPGIKDVFFMPNGGTKVSEYIPFKNRAIDVLYMGGCQQPTDYFPPINGLPEQGMQFYTDVISVMADDPSLTTESAMEKWFCERNIDVTDDVLLTLNLQAAPYIENYIRRFFKLAGMHALDRAGVHVEIYGGDSWVDKDEPFSDNIHINPRISSEEMNSIISKARISLCFIPWYKRGCSEKNFDSMLNGALCVSDRSEYLEDHYPDGENIVYFDLRNPDQMACDIKWLLDNPSKAERIARKGYETAQKYDTWTERFRSFTEEIIPEVLNRNDVNVVDAFMNLEMQGGKAIMSNERLKLYIVSCHVDKPLTQEPPKSKYDVTIQAGAALTDMRVCELNDLDDCPGSVSDRNSRYSEASAMYWIGRHIDSDYVGIVHYRRRLDLTDEQYDKYMDEGVDIITTHLIDLGQSIENDYREVLYSADWDLFMDILKERDQGEFEFYKKCLSSNLIHACNINVFRAELYREFSEWAFPILDEFWKRSPEKTDTYQHRDVGFIAERLSHLFVMRMIRDGKKVVEAPLKDLRSDDWDCKKECNYDDLNEVFETCDRLYKAHQITKCCNVVGESVRRGGNSDPKIAGLSEVMVAGIVERRELPKTMHEYLPEQFRSDLNTLLYIWDALKKALQTYMSLKNEESSKLLEDILALTHFSNVARKEALRHIMEDQNT